MILYMNTWRALTAALLAMAASLAQAATIDRMDLATFGGYTQTYYPGGRFMVLSQADQYVLSDGSTWDAGAGSHPDTLASLASVSVTGDQVRYSFLPPTSGVLFTNTDYNAGEHSAQGTLGLPNALALVATLGSTTGTISGYTQILSNTETYYGQPRFNHYSAPVGSYVFFEQTVTLVDGHTFTADLFSSSFVYNERGYVNFSQSFAVPEPATAGLWLLGLAGLVAVGRGKRRQAA